MKQKRTIASIVGVLVLAASALVVGTIIVKRRDSPRPLIAQALAEASATHRNVALVFGAKW